MSESKYIQFPLCLLQETYKNPVESLHMIGSFGIKNFANKIDYRNDEVARQLLYVFYRERDKLPSGLEEFADPFATDDDYNGFAGKEFYPAETYELQIALENDPKTLLQAIGLYQLRQAASLLNVTIGCYERSEKEYENGLYLLNRFEQKFGKDAWPSCKTTMLFDFRDSLKDIDLFRAYIGIKSLIGRKEFVSTCKPIIVQRMCGAKSKAALKEALKTKEIKETYSKFSKRWQADKLLNILQERGFITKLPYGRQIFITTGSMDLKMFAEVIAEKQAKNNSKKQEKEAAEYLRSLLV